MKTIATLMLAALLFAGPAWAQYDSGSDGSMGVLSPSSSVTIPLPADGVLHYTDVDIPTGVTVTFERNPRNTPVYLLSQNDILLNGTISVSGGTAATINTVFITRRGGLGGPGGQDGGSSRIGNGLDAGAHGQGIGPGGAGASAQSYYGGGGGASPVTGGMKPKSASSGGVAWAQKEFWMLSGGSGGGASPGTGGGGGAGVLTLAASGTITINGGIYANGGKGDTYAGFGGAGIVRVVAGAISGSGTIQAVGNSSSCNNSGTACGGNGLIRLESFETIGALTTKCTPTPEFGLPGKALPYPTPALVPTVTIVSAHQQDLDPEAPYDMHPLVSPDLVLPQGSLVSVTVEATNVPPGTTVNLILTTVGKGRAVYESPPLAGTQELSTVTMDIPIPAGTRIGTLQAYIPEVPVPAGDG